MGMAGLLFATTTWSKVYSSSSITALQRLHYRPPVISTILSCCRYIMIAPYDDLTHHHHHTLTYYILLSCLLKQLQSICHHVTNCTTILYDYEGVTLGPSMQPMKITL